MKKWTFIWLLLIMVCFLFGSGFLHRKINLYENMVDASVVLYSSQSGGSGVFIYDNVVLTAAHVLEDMDVCNIELSDGTVLESSDFYIDATEDVGFV